MYKGNEKKKSMSRKAGARENYDVGKLIKGDWANYGNEHSRGKK